MTAIDNRVAEPIYFPQDAPEAPAVFVARAERNGVEHIAQVGVTLNLRKSLDGVWEKQMRSAGSASAHLSEVRWWLHEDFHDPVVLEAAGLVALDAFDRKANKKPHNAAAWQLHNDESFCIRMAGWFSAEPHGRLVVLSLPQVFHRLRALEGLVHQLAKRVEIAFDSETTKH